QYHLSNDELPACAFPPDVEKTYDRSFRRFAQMHK
ncbi:MAG: cytosolic protein, partial [Armatimonadetes bacterium]|nr:cytosolic protein [Armatimonadota bacterium]